MKKILFVMMACVAMTFSFTACDNDSINQADPATQPIAGKTYRQTLATGDAYYQLTFHKDYKCTLVVKEDGKSPVSNPYFEWWMSPNDTQVEVRYAKGAYDKSTGMSLSGQEFLSGTYDATTKTVSLTGEFHGEKMDYQMTEVQ